MIAWDQKSKPKKDSFSGTMLSCKSKRCLFVFFFAWEWLVTPCVASLSLQRLRDFGPLKSIHFSGAKLLNFRNVNCLSDLFTLLICGFCAGEIPITPFFWNPFKPNPKFMEYYNGFYVATAPGSDRLRTSPKISSICGIGKEKKEWFL